MAFEAELKKAEDAQAAAEQLVEVAEMAFADVGTDEARTAAQAAIEAAQKALNKAVDDARALAALAHGDANLRGRAEDRIGKAEAAQRAGEAKLAAGEAGIAAAQATATQWSARAGFARSAVPTLPEVRAVRRIRTNAAGNGHSPDLLSAASFPAVPYEPGKVLISEGEAASGDLLRMRGFVPTIIGNTSRWIANSYGGGFDYGNGSPFVAGLRITSAGLVVSMGGRGAEGPDLRRRVGRTGSSHFPGGLNLNDPNARDDRGWDLTVTFGEPASSPEGNGEFYWAARLMPDPSQIADGVHADTRGRLLVDGRPSPVGTYTLWLSNHADVETNLEPAEGGSYPGRSYPDDDDNFFLKYAAYGMMTFQASDRFPYAFDRYERVHNFHLGYDAFADEDDRRTTDIGEAVSDGKFTGLAMALELDRIDRGSPSDVTTSIDLRATKRLRGEVELTATISGTASSNRISGTIGNLEVWDGRGYWKDYASIPGDIALGSGSINAAGHYRGTITGVAGFGDGQYFGRFYGPVSGLETAGAWVLQGTNTGADAVRRAIAGSFGARRAPLSE